MYPKTPVGSLIPNATVLSDKAVSELFRLSLHMQINTIIKGLDGGAQSFCRSAFCQFGIQYALPQEDAVRQCHHGDKDQASSNIKLVVSCSRFSSLQNCKKCLFFVNNLVSRMLLYQHKMNQDIHLLSTYYVPGRLKNTQYV